MIRKLLIVLGTLGVLTFLRAFWRSIPSETAAPRPRGPRFDGSLVRDRVCQTFLPRARALGLRADGEEHFFCSEACRSRFLEARRKAS